MKCPRCAVRLRESDLGEQGFVILDSCPSCHGIWLDKGELDRVDGSVWTNAEGLQFAPAAAGHSKIKCPRCNATMEPLTPPEADELVIDRCPSCLGFWLDAGELDSLREVASAADALPSPAAGEGTDAGAVAGASPGPGARLTHRPPEWSWWRWTAYSLRRFGLQR